MSQISVRDERHTDAPSKPFGQFWDIPEFSLFEIDNRDSKAVYFKFTKSTPKILVVLNGFGDPAGHLIDSFRDDVGCRPLPDLHLELVLTRKQ